MRLCLTHLRARPIFRPRPKPFFCNLCATDGATRLRHVSYESHPDIEQPMGIATETCPCIRLIAKLPPCLTLTVDTSLRVANQRPQGSFFDARRRTSINRLGANLREALIPIQITQVKQTVQKRVFDNRRKEGSTGRFPTPSAQY